MPDEPADFFKGLIAPLRSAGFAPSNPATKTGMDLWTTRDGSVRVTANYAPGHDRVSVKLTVNRGRKGGATPVFDAVRSRFEPQQAKLDGHVSWSPAPNATESKIQVRRTISEATSAAHHSWVVANAIVLRDWAQWAGKVK